MTRYDRGVAWEPLLRGHRLEHAARTAVADVARALAAGVPDADFDLANGNAGIALLYGYLGTPEADGIAAALLDRAGDRVASTVVAAALFDGFTGVAWAGDHLRRVHGDTDPALNTEIDGVLCELLAAPWRGPWDLVGGLVGLGVYLLERAGSASADLALGRVLDQLAPLVESSFWTAPSSLPDPVRRDWPAGCWDFGMAHGVPGLVALLARVAELPHAAAPRALRLLEQTVPWLLARQRGDLATAYASREAPGRPPRPARSGWCYGDAALALAIARAGGVGDPAWVDAALAIARRATTRPAEDTGVRDGSLCHGAAGLAQIFGRWFELTGEPVFAEAARDWLERTLAFRSPAHPETGGFYQATLADPVATPGLLDGAAGSALVLLGAISERPPDWDRALLLS